MYCVHCGAENPADATFCQKCGKRLPTTDQDESTILSFPSALSSPYERTPYTSTPSTASDPVFAPSLLSTVRSSGEIATTYYVALTHGDYQTAYNQLSTASRSKITEPGFVHVWQALGGVKAWSVTTIHEQGSTANAALTLTLGNGQTAPASIALIDENGVWKIENETIRISAIATIKNNGYFNQ